MITGRFDHAAVSMGNKMFVVGGYNTISCEVFDSYSRKFTLIQSMFSSRSRATFLNFNSKATSIGNNILVTCAKDTVDYKDTCMYIYNVCKNQWSQNSCYVIKICLI